MPDVLNRDEFERQMARITGGQLARQRRELMNLLGEPPSLDNVPIEWWLNGGTPLARAIEPLLFEIFIQQAEAVQAASQIGVSYDLVNEAAANWAQRHAAELVMNIDNTTQQRVRQAVGRYFMDGQTIGELEQSIGVWFSSSRAEAIAITEVTQAASQGEMAHAALVMQDNPNIRMIPIWNTNEDELVCIICGERDGKEQGDGWTEPPPAHPRCRCFLSHEARRINA